MQNEKFIHYGLLDVFFNSFAYAENFLNTTRVTVTGDLIEVVKMAKVMKVLDMSKELFNIKNFIFEIVLITLSDVECELGFSGK